MNPIPIKYCVFDNNDGPIAYVYEQEQASQLTDLLQKSDPENNPDSNGFYRFAFETVSDYPEDLQNTILEDMKAGFQK